VTRGLGRTRDLMTSNDRHGPPSLATLVYAHTPRERPNYRAPRSMQSAAENHHTDIHTQRYAQRHTHTYLKDTHIHPIYSEPPPDHRHRSSPPFHSILSCLYIWTHAGMGVGWIDLYIIITPISEHILFLGTYYNIIIYYARSSHLRHYCRDARPNTRVKNKKYQRRVCTDYLILYYYRRT